LRTGRRGRKPIFMAELSGRLDVITTFDVIHDSADPRGILRAIHDALEPTGVDIDCAENPEDNAGPRGTVPYGSSLAYCMPVSLASGGAGLAPSDYHQVGSTN
jgi:2-polyprenyl-3-methyl-5-hydroxy-6-metoxy-1,4-benzoquinol methylase